jgi:nucleoside-triphosphatase
VDLLAEAGVPVSGFVTEEIRERGRRVGFRIETPGGESGVLAHVDLEGPPRVGKYGVDLDAFERIALPALAGPHGDGVVVIDELGKMELASSRFRDAVSELLEGDLPVVATVHAHRHRFTDPLKGRLGIEVLRVTGATRDDLPTRLAERLT